MELKDYLKIVRRRWLTILVLTVAGLAVAQAYNVLAPRTYQSEATSFVSVTTGGNPATANTAYSASQFALQRVKSYAELGTSNQVLDPVISSLHLPDSASELASRVSVVNPTDTVVLDTTVTASSPAAAADIANAVASSLGTAIQRLEAAGSTTSSPVVVTVVKRAAPNLAPISPTRSLDLILGLIVGLCLGFAAAAVRERLHANVRTAADIEEVTGKPLLGTIELGSARRRAGGRRGRRQDLARWRALRSIRTRLLVRNDDRLPARIAVTPVSASLPTSLVVELAEAITTNGGASCVVETDLRARQMRRHRASGAHDADGAEGLGGIVRGAVTVSSQLQPIDGDGRLAVLPSGEGVADPAAALGGPTMRAVLADVSRQYRTVLLLTAPALDADEVQVVAKLADGVLLFCEYGVTRRDLTAAFDALELAGGTVVGVVLVRRPRRAWLPRRSERLDTAVPAVDAATTDAPETDAPEQDAGATPDRDVVGLAGSRRPIQVPSLSRRRALPSAPVRRRSVHRDPSGTAGGHTEDESGDLDPEAAPQYAPSHEARPERGSVHAPTAASRRVS